MPMHLVASRQSISTVVLRLALEVSVSPRVAAWRLGTVVPSFVAGRVRVPVSGEAVRRVH